VSEVADGIIHAIAQALWDEPLARAIAGKSSPPGSWAILALGKSGARSLAFHSDLDLVFVHRIDDPAITPKESIAAERFFEDLAGRFVRLSSERGPGFLYRVDTRLRPFGAAGSLSVPFEKLEEYYRSGEARVWERLALLRARPVFVQGFDSEFLRAELVRLALAGRPDESRIWEDLATVRARSLRAIENSQDDLKKGEGGSQAIELFLQALQLIHSPTDATAIEQDEWNVIRQMESAGLLSTAQAATLWGAYGLYRQLDSALRLYRNRSPEQLRVEPKELPYIARMIDSPELSPGPASLSENLASLRSRVQESIGCLS